MENIRRLMKGEPQKELLPWFKGFAGTIEKNTEDRYKVHGNIRKVNSTTLEITELPLRTWTQSYKEQLEDWISGDKAFIKVGFYAF